MTESRDAYHLVEYCVGTVYDRGKLSEVREVWARGVRAQHEGPAFHSGFLFGDDAAKHVATHRNKDDLPTLAGYEGKHRAPYLLIDIDNHDNDPENAKAQCDDVLRVLVELGVDMTFVLVCFSGNKGYHLYVPTGYFAPEPSEDVGDRLRWVVDHGIWPRVNKELFKDPEEIDRSIYRTISLYRAINSRHEKSGLWKIPLTLKEFQERSFADVRTMAVGPRKDFAFPDWKQVKAVACELTELWKTSATWETERRRSFEDAEKSGERKVHDVSGIPGLDPKAAKNRRLCAVQIGRIDVGKGNRNAAVLLLASDLRDEGFTPEQTFDVMKPWLKLQVGTKHDDAYLRAQVAYVFGGDFHWGCHHPLAMQHCFRECRWFPKADVERRAAEDLQTIDVLIDRLRERARTPAFYELPYGPFRQELRLRSKQVVVLVAETGTGKTALAIDIVRHQSVILRTRRENQLDLRAGCAFLSLEMPGEELAERHLQFVRGVGQREIESMLRNQNRVEEVGGTDEEFQRLARRASELMTDVYFYDGKALDMKGLRELIVAGKEAHGIDFVVIDFLDRIRSRGKSQYERLESITLDMKDLARELDVQVWVLAQVARDESAKGKLGLRSARGSGQIEENADIVLTLERMTPEELSEHGFSDDRGSRHLILRSPKVRSGDGHGVAMLKFTGTTMTFEDVTPTAFNFAI